MTILIFLAVLGVLVIVHELGHFTVAKLMGVRVLEFGIGFPPKVFGFRRGDTDYTLNLLPLGGFVRMLGEEDPSHPGSFAGKSAWQRLAILFAGSGMNAVLPVLLLTLAFMIPQPVVVTDVVVRQVEPDSPAQAAGVMPGDFVRIANGRSIDNSGDLLRAIQLRLGADVALTVERGGRLRELHIAEARVAPPEGQGAIGVLLVDARVSVGSAESGSAAARAGLASGDLFLRAGPASCWDDGCGQRVLRESDLAVVEEPGEPVRVEVLRRGSIVTLDIDTGSGALDGLAVDVRPEESRSQGPISAFGSSFTQIGEILLVFRNEVSRWIAGSSGIQLAGPVGIAQITGDVARAGLSPLITWTALLSINLAIVNLLPIPALDGGRITFVLLELARGGRRLAPQKERIVHLAGFALLIGTVIIISVNDIRRLVSGADFF